MAFGVGEELGETFAGQRESGDIADPQDLALVPVEDGNAGDKGDVIRWQLTLAADLSTY